VYDQAVARGKARYDRFLKSVGIAMVGDSEAAMKGVVRPWQRKLNTSRNSGFGLAVPEHRGRAKRSHGLPR
jgi:hypothetical protein